jgi:hypothetical protein
MNAFARLILSAGLVAGIAVPAMAQTTSHVVKHRAPVAHHVAKASPVAATAPAPVKPVAVTAAPLAAKPVVPAKN